MGRPYCGVTDGDGGSGFPKFVCGINVCAGGAGVATPKLTANGTFFVYSWINDDTAAIAVLGT
jgi:hypothetical protein